MRFWSISNWFSINARWWSNIWIFFFRQVSGQARHAQLNLFGNKMAKKNASVLLIQWPIERGTLDRHRSRSYVNSYRFHSKWSTKLIDSNKMCQCVLRLNGSIVKKPWKLFFFFLTLLSYHWKCNLISVRASWMYEYNSSWLFPLMQQSHEIVNDIYFIDPNREHYGENSSGDRNTVSLQSPAGLIFDHLDDNITLICNHYHSRSSKNNKKHTQK